MTQKRGLLIFRKQMSSECRSYCCLKCEKRRYIKNESELTYLLWRFWNKKKRLLLFLPKKTSFQKKVSTVTYELCSFKSSKVNTLHSNDKVTSTNINICAETKHHRGHVAQWLTHFMSLASFYTPWKHQKTRGFLFLGGIEKH